MMVLFILCCNLRDWIMTDDTVPFDNDLKAIETSVPCMRRCRAVATTGNQRTSARVQVAVIHDNSRAKYPLKRGPDR